MIILNDVFSYAIPQLQSHEPVLSDLTHVSVSTEWTVDYLVSHPHSSPVVVPAVPSWIGLVCTLLICTNEE